MRTKFRCQAAAGRIGLRISAFLLLTLVSLGFAHAADGVAPISQFETLRLNVPSRNFGSLIPTVAFVPRGTPPSAGWPVVLLLHGLGGSEVDWTALGEADATYAKLLANNAVRPAVIVMPGMSSNWYVDSVETGGIKAETAIVSDFLPYLRETLHLSKDAQDTSIIGNSMGGYGALRLSLKYPDIFGRVAVLSPAIWQNVPADEMNLPPERIRLLMESTYFGIAKPWPPLQQGVWRAIRSAQVQRAEPVHPSRKAPRGRNEAPAHLCQCGRRRQAFALARRYCALRDDEGGASAYRVSHDGGRSHMGCMACGAAGCVEVRDADKVRLLRFAQSVRSS